MSDGSVGKRKRSPSTKAVEAVANSADEAAAKKSRASSPKRTAKGAAKEPAAMDRSSSSSSSSAAAPVPVSAAVAAVAIRELPEAFVQLLLNTRVEEFQAEKFQHKPIYHCQYKDRIVDVFRGLSHMNIMSVPVTKKDEHTYSAFIDIMDIVRYVVEHFGADEMGKDRSFWDLVAESKDFNDLTVQNLAHRPSRWNPIQPIKIGFSLFSAFEMLARTRGLRRLIVVNQNHGLQNLITQSGILDFLFDNIDLLGAKGKKKLADCPFFKRVITVKETDQAFEAFKKMSDRNIMGVAIIDESGRVKGALSVRDLKLVSTDLRLFWRLHQTIKNFTIKVREEFAVLYKRPKRLVFAHPNDTLEIVIRKIHRHKVHRVYIIDNDRRPIGLVSLRDLMTEIIREKPEAASAFVDAYRAAQQNEAAAVPDIEGEAYPDTAADTAVTAATVMPAQVPAALPLPPCDYVPASVFAGGPLDLFRMEFEALQNAASNLTEASLLGKEIPIVGAAMVPPASSSSSSGAAAAAAAPAK